MPLVLKASKEPTPSAASTPITLKPPAVRKESKSLILKAPRDRNASTSSNAARIKLVKRQSTGPKLRRIHVKGRVPDRVPGNAYDSEDSERELDPAIEQHLVLRMEPGEDCDFLRKAINERTIGLPPQEGGSDVAFKFLDKDLRRATVTIRQNMYAAVLVDLPCIVETMKSWDKRQWWKVADISQMLLVLGRVNTEEEAKHMALPPRVINERTMAFSHGLTPPMRRVRERRFRKRLSHKDNLNAEDEVNKLLEEDARVEREGGEVNWDITGRESLERSAEPDDYFGEQEEDGAMDTIENAYEEADAGEEVDEMDLEDMEAMFEQDNANMAESPAAMSFAEQAPSHQQEESSDEDEDDDDDLDAFDEDAQAQAAELNLHNQEIADLENEIALQRQKLEATKNMLLLNRQQEKLKVLEEDLRVKRRAYGYDQDDED